jgi:hypothetical protein
MCLGANAVHQVQDDQWGLPPVKVVTPDGGIQAFKRSVTVAELIKLHPDHFVCHSKALITALTQKAVLPKDLQLEAGRLYYVLPISKLQEQEQELQLEPKLADDLMGHHDKVIARRAPGASGAHGAVKLDPLQPFEINLVQSKRQQQQQQQQPPPQHQMPGFAQVTLLRAAGDYEKETPIISYSTPDLRSMYLMNGPPSSSSKKATPMLTRSNSWKPRLETISEVRAFSRRRIQKLVNRAGSRTWSQFKSSNVPQL